MRRSVLAAVVALLGLGGCVAVPVYDSGGAYGYDGYGYYSAPPAATFSFGYYYFDDDRRHRRGPRHHRHRHRHHRR